jgi:hypothetical protein
MPTIQGFSVNRSWLKTMRKMSSFLKRKMWALALRRCLQVQQANNLCPKKEVSPLKKWFKMKRTMRVFLRWTKWALELRLCLLNHPRKCTRKSLNIISKCKILTLLAWVVLQTTLPMMFREEQISLTLSLKLKVWEMTCLLTMAM